MKPVTAGDAERDTLQLKPMKRKDALGEQQREARNELSGDARPDSRLFILTFHCAATNNPLSVDWGVSFVVTC